MAKGIRSKVKKRWRSLKRMHLENVKVRSDIEGLSSKLLAGTQNKPYRTIEPKNMFLYPNDPESQIPQFHPPPLIDFRSSSMPYAGTQYAGSRRVKAQKKAEAQEAVESVEVPQIKKKINKMEVEEQVEKKQNKQKRK